MKLAFVDNKDGYYECDSLDGKTPLWAVGMTLTTVRVPPTPTLAEAKAAQIANINQAADAAFNSLLASYPKQEVDTWSYQYTEAQAYQLNALAATPTLSAIALAYGTTVPLLATSVLAKAATYTGTSGQVVGKRKKLTDQINAATTNAGVGVIVW